VNQEDNSFYKEFRVPDDITGQLSVTQRRLLFRIPEEEAIVDETYTPKGADLRIQLKRVALYTPRQHPGPRGFTDCVRVETRTQGQVHYRYLQEGTGEVGLEVYNVGEAPGSLPAEGDEPVYGHYRVMPHAVPEAPVGEGSEPGERR
jgi:hypothetical protein